MMPFGFGGYSRQTTPGLAQSTVAQPGTATTPPVPVTKGRSPLPVQTIRKMMAYGMKSGSPLGGMMGFMELPWWSRNGNGRDNPGPWRYMNPWDYMNGGNGNGQHGGGGNNGGGNNGGGDNGGGDNGGGDNGGGDNGGGNGGNSTPWTPIDLLYPPAIGTGAQWRNTMKYGA